MMFRKDQQKSLRCSPQVCPINSCGNKIKQVNHFMMVYTNQFMMILEMVCGIGSHYIIISLKMLDINLNERILKLRSYSYIIIISTYKNVNLIYTWSSARFNGRTKNTFGCSPASFRSRHGPLSGASSHVRTTLRSRCCSLAWTDLCGSSQW